MAGRRRKPIDPYWAVYGLFIVIFVVAVIFWLL